MGLKTPESVYYDAVDDLYLVSNINGSPKDKDNNGFISKISPDGQVVSTAWIEGGQNGVTLNAPKGMAAVDDTLYVADIDTLRAYSLSTGLTVAEIEIPESSFLNDRRVVSRWCTTICRLQRTLDTMPYETEFWCPFLMKIRYGFLRAFKFQGALNRSN